MIEKQFEPDWASKPGNSISEFLSQKNISREHLSQSLEVTLQTVDDLIEGNKEINLAIAKKLSNTLGGSDSFWINKEMVFQKMVNSDAYKKRWLQQFDLTELLKLGWISKKNEYYIELMNFFNTQSILEWERKYRNNIHEYSFRKSKSFSSKLTSTVCWLRKAEIIGNSINCKTWNIEKVEDKIEEIKKLSRISNPSIFLPKLYEVCKDLGIAFVVLRAPKKCKASGASKFLNNNKTLIVQSFRHLSDDHFWFTFFHELGHLILHRKEKTFVDSNNKKDYQSDDTKELEANIFSTEALLSYKNDEVLKHLKRDKRSIVKASMKLGISPGILIGQMQHKGIIDYSYMNGYKRRYNWKELNETISRIYPEK